jgi:outer membrane protein assembly factor BamD (BamD/ComL family)
MRRIAALFAMVSAQAALGVSTTLATRSAAETPAPLGSSLVADAVFGPSAARGEIERVNADVEAEAVAPSASSEDLAPSRAQVLSFADALLEEGDHYRAITEYKRFLFLAPGSAHADAARMKIGLAYLRGEQFDAAISTFRAIATVHPAQRPEASLHLALAAYRGGKLDDAHQEVTRWQRAFSASHPTHAHRAAYLRGWISLELGDDAGAAQAFAQVPPEANGPKLAEAAKNAAQLPRKSPVLAGLLAILPGAGHLYVEQPMIGAAALLWNALFGYALYESIVRGQIGVSVVLGLFEALWYGGNIFGAVSAAQKYNRDTRTNFLEALKKAFEPAPESWPPAAVPRTLGSR